MALTQEETHFVEALVLWGPLQNALHDTFQLVHGGRLLGVREDGRLLTPDH